LNPERNLFALDHCEEAVLFETHNHFDLCEK